MLRNLIFACLFAASAPIAAQYPSRPILLVVPYTAGSDADLAARNLAQHAPRYLDGQSLIVMNQPGASGAIGTLAVRNASPDGYRLLLTRIASQVILPAMDRKTPYRWDDFTFMSVLEINPYVCAVRGNAPYASMTDLIADIKKQPGRLNFATVGDGSLQNFGPQYLFSLAGLPKDAAVGIPYKGSGDLTASLLGGQVHFACSNLGALLGHFRAGVLRPLMTTTHEPLKDLPSTPTARSLGWPEMERLAAWSALAGPPRLPRDVVERWTDVLAKLAKDPAWLAGVAKLGGIPAVRSPAATEIFVRDQYRLYEGLAERLGLRQ
ncbi:MAG TPA: tripartite tricarboxylate transporter substrate binding protein [Burkholderiales bacterium]|nr:tripartite tricarboxylate transporter substrate binding protein [Burkholderiales bacterium]